MINMLKDWAEGKNTIKKINSRTRTDNPRGIPMCKKFGVKEEGVSRKELFINEVFISTFCY